jgi:hypothetical protein
MKEVRLRVGGQLIQTKVSWPFQMRWQPTVADVGSVRTLTVEAEDAAGNVTTTTRDVRVAAARRDRGVADPGRPVPDRWVAGRGRDAPLRGWVPERAHVAPVRVVP